MKSSMPSQLLVQWGKKAALWSRLLMAGAVFLPAESRKKQAYAAIPSVNPRGDYYFLQQLCVLHEIGKSRRQASSRASAHETLYGATQSVASKIRKGMRLSVPGFRSSKTRFYPGMEHAISTCHGSTCVHCASASLISSQAHLRDMAARLETTSTEDELRQRDAHSWESVVNQELFSATKRAYWSDLAEAYLHGQPFADGLAVADLVSLKSKEETNSLAMFPKRTDMHPCPESAKPGRRGIPYGPALHTARELFQPLVPPERDASARPCFAYGYACNAEYRRRAGVLHYVF